MSRRARTMLGGLMVTLGLAAIAPVSAASAASVTPGLTLSQPATQAGSMQSLAQDATFAYSNSGDSVKDLTLTLPPGLLANAAIDGGGCLKTTILSSPCQVASGTVTAAATVALLPVTVNVPVSLYLVPPPKPADLAGLQIVANDPPLITGPLGGPGDVVVQPPDAHVTITFNNVPNTAQVVAGLTLPISVQSIQTTLSSMRLPTKCSGLPPFGLSVTTYDGAAATTSRPLSVTGCSNLALTPKFTVNAARDATDSGAQVTTDLQQPQPLSAPFQATAGSVELTLPPKVLGPNVVGALNVICAKPAPYTGCTAVGSATSMSPLYPSALTGKAYLVGSLATPALAIVFPPPFSINLTGVVSPGSGSTTFTGVPDLPLSDLKVVLSGGRNSVFAAFCAPSSGTASATLTSQAGDRTATSLAPFTVAGCPPASGGTGTGSGNSGGRPGARGGRPSVTSASITGLGTGLARLRLRVRKGNNAAAIRSVAIELPRGLSLRHGRSHGHSKTVVQVIGAHPQRVRLVRGRLLVVLSRAVGTVTIRVAGIRESASLERRAKHHHLRSLSLGVGVTDASGLGTLLRVVVHALRL